MNHIERTIATVRQHRPESWWVSAAHNLADEVERLDRLVAELQQLKLDDLAAATATTDEDTR